MVVISRVGVRAKPAKNHPEYKEWETANVFVLVAADSRKKTLEQARKVLRKEKWELLEVRLLDRLIEEQVREQGGAILELPMDPRFVFSQTTSRRAMTALLRFSRCGSPNRSSIR